MPADAATMTCPRCHARLRIPADKGLAHSRCPRCRLPLDHERPGRGGCARSPRQLGPYRLGDRLGVGSMGRVYRTTFDGRDMAIKILARQAAEDAELFHRFEREARLGLALKHPNLVRVHRQECFNDHHCLVMDLVDGPSLEQVVDHEGALPWRRAVGYMIQVAEAVDHLHRRGIIHRDLKPENIHLDGHDRPRLLDLGFSKELEPADGERLPSDLTISGTSLGSPAYMAPEQVGDAANASRACDIYGIASTLFHLVTGVLPFDGRSAVEVMERVLREPVPRIRQHHPDLPAALDELLAWAMAKEPELRPENAGALARMLEYVGEHPADAATVRRERRQRRRLPLRTMALYLVVLVGFSAVCLWLVLMS